MSRPYRGYPEMQEFQIENKQLKYGWSSHLYDTDAGTVLGRTRVGWAKLFYFYLIFYTCLAALFAICMATFLQHFINPRVPRLQQERSVIGTSPGLGFRPLPADVRSTLIYYKGTSHSSYKYWEDQLIEFLSVYKTKGQTAGAGQNIAPCGFDITPEPGKVCDVNIREWKPCIDENHFSFHLSSPCIFLKLNRIYGWRPEYYNETQNLPADMPDQLRNQIYNISKIHGPSHLNMVWVSCQGETPADKENVGKISYLPQAGFPGYYYPYNNAEGYLSPLVAIHLEGPKTGILINIECRAWARNIMYSRRDRLGVVHFELMLE